MPPSWVFPVTPPPKACSAGRGREPCGFPVARPPTHHSERSEESLFDVCIKTTDDGGLQVSWSPVADHWSLFASRYLISDY
jgi:hypothetical protein